MGKRSITKTKLCLTKRQSKYSIDITKIDPSVIKDKIVSFLDSDKPSAKITSVLLGIIALGGVVTVAMVAPNIFSGYGRARYRKRYNQRIYSTLYYAVKRGYARKRGKRNGNYTLTKKGREILYFEVLKDFKITPLDKWDNCWRIVIFDIPNTRDKARDFLRCKLKNLGFKQLQKSVFIIPWPCLSEIDMLRKAFKVKKYVTLLRAQYVEEEEALIRFFSLKA